MRLAAFDGCVTNSGAAAAQIENAHARKNSPGYTGDYLCPGYSLTYNDHTDDHPEYTGQGPVVNYAVSHIIVPE